jgi:hypothetical protein
MYGGRKVEQIGCINVRGLVWVCAWYGIAAGGYRKDK